MIKIEPFRTPSDMFKVLIGSPGPERIRPPLVCFSKENAQLDPKLCTKIGT